MNKFVDFKDMYLEYSEIYELQKMKVLVFQRSSCLFSLIDFFRAKDQEYRRPWYGPIPLPPDHQGT